MEGKGRTRLKETAWCVAGGWRSLHSVYTEVVGEREGGRGGREGARKKESRFCIQIYALLSYNCTFAVSKPKKSQVTYNPNKHMEDYDETQEKSLHTIMQSIVHNKQTMTHHRADFNGFLFGSIRTIPAPER